MEVTELHYIEIFHESNEGVHQQENDGQVVH